MSTHDNSEYESVRVAIAAAMEGTPPYTEESRQRARSSMQRVETGESCIFERRSNLPYGKLEQESEQRLRFALPRQGLELTRRPLLIWLHGRNSSEADIETFMPYIGPDRLAAVGLRGNISGEGHSIYDWQLDRLDDIEALIDDCLAIAARTGAADCGKIFLGGQDVGGTLAMHIAVRRPELFQGVISLNGIMFDETKRTLARLRSNASPLLIIQGERSQSFPDTVLTELLQLMFLSGTEAQIRQYSTDDAVTDQQLRDIGCWIEERIAPVVASMDCPAVRVIEAQPIESTLVVK